MGEKFTFDVAESLDVIEKTLKIAEKYQNDQGFDGELAKRLLELDFDINNENFINILNSKLITCKNFSGIKISNIKQMFGKPSLDNDILQLYEVALFLVIYVRELNFRNNIRMDKGNSFYSLTKLVRDNREEFIENLSWCLDLFDDMPSLIMQEEFHSEHALALSKALQSTDIAKVEDFIQTRNESIAKIDTWNSELESKKQAVETLKDKLETYQTAFNFVGLYQGFSQLKEAKDKELLLLNKQYFTLVLLMVGIPVIEFIWLFKNLNENFQTIQLVVLALPSITLLLILFWFFRIILQNVKSVKSQIMQLELRMTLCQFIQSYAEKSKDLKEHNKEGFEKFESLIFSSIVSSDEKIPFTFDGVEQLSTLLKNFKSNI